MSASTSISPASVQTGAAAFVASGGGLTSLAPDFLVWNLGDLPQGAIENEVLTVNGIGGIGDGTFALSDGSSRILGTPSVTDGGPPPFHNGLDLFAATNAPGAHAAILSFAAAQPGGGSGPVTNILVLDNVIPHGG